MRWLVPVIAACLLAGCTAGPMPSVQQTASPPAAATPATTPATASPSPSTAPPVELCLAEARALTLDARIGQLIMVGVSGGLDAAERRALTNHHIGSVVLLGNQSGGVAATAELTRSLLKLDPEAALLVAADQEGGLVQRLSGPGFSRIPSAAMQAKQSDAELREAAKKLGRPTRRGRSPAEPRPGGGRRPGGEAVAQRTDRRARPRLRLRPAGGHDEDGGGDRRSAATRARALR